MPRITLIAGDADAGVDLWARAGLAAGRNRDCPRDQKIARSSWTWQRTDLPRDVLRDSLVMPNRKNPNLSVKRVFLPGAELGLTGALLLWAKEQDLADDEPLFFSRKVGVDGARRALQRGQAWLIVNQASERAAVRVLALRASKYGRAGEPAPVHPHLFRHPRERQIVRSTRNLPLAQRQAGWSRLQTDDGAPEDSGRLHSNVGDAQVIDPSGQLCQLGRHRPEGAHLAHDRAIRLRNKYARDDGALVHVKSTASRVNDVHDRSSSTSQVWRRRSAERTTKCRVDQPLLAFTDGRDVVKPGFGFL